MNFKFGVLFAKDGQLTDDEMFSNGEQPLPTPAEGDPALHLTPAERDPALCCFPTAEKLNIWLGWRLQSQEAAKYFTDHLTSTGPCSTGPCDGPWGTQRGGEETHKNLKNLVLQSARSFLAGSG